MIVASILPHVELEANHNREDAPHFNLELQNKNEFSRSVFQTASEMYVESADDSLDEITSESGILTIMDPTWSEISKFFLVLVLVGPVEPCLRFRR